MPREASDAWPIGTAAAGSLAPTELPHDTFETIDALKFGALAVLAWAEKGLVWDRSNACTDWVSSPCPWPYP